jgi:formate-dependent nitrite reductase membrane component NrfD
MDSPIQLIEHTDQATKQMLENVRKRKKKFDDTKRWHYFSIYLTLTFALIFITYFYMTIYEHSSYSFLAVLSATINDTYSVYLLSIVLIGLGAMNVLKQQKDKKEKEYQELRCEIVDRSKDLWKKEEEWKNRHVVFEMMKKKYDINLYHEKK